MPKIFRVTMQGGNKCRHALVQVGDKWLRCTVHQNDDELDPTIADAVRNAYRYPISFQELNIELSNWGATLQDAYEDSPEATMKLLHECRERYCKTLGNTSKEAVAQERRRLFEVANGLREENDDEVFTDVPHVRLALSKMQETAGLNTKVQNFLDEVLALEPSQ